MKAKMKKRREEYIKNIERLDPAYKVENGGLGGSSVIKYFQYSTSLKWVPYISIIL